MLDKLSHNLSVVSLKVLILNNKRANFFYRKKSKKEIEELKIR